MPLSLEEPVPMDLSGHSACSCYAGSMFRYLLCHLGISNLLLFAYRWGYQNLQIFGEENSVENQENREIYDVPRCTYWHQNPKQNWLISHIKIL